MLYSIHVKYFHPVEQKDVEVDLILELPQMSLADARNNVFVRDLVRHPFVKAHSFPLSLVKLPEDALIPYNGSLPADVEVIPVIYQEDNNSDQVWHRQFDFKIYVTKPRITTIGSMVSGFKFAFTCPLQYNAYYDIFASGNMVVLPGQIKTLRDGDLVRVTTVAIKQAAIVSNNPAGGMDIAIYPNRLQTMHIIGQNSIAIPNIEQIPLSFGLLQSIGWTANVADVFSKIELPHYEIVLPFNGGTETIRVAYVDHKFFFVEPDSKTPQGYNLHPIAYLCTLQSFILSTYSIKYEAKGYEDKLYDFVYKLNQDCQIVHNLPNQLKAFTNTFIASNKDNPKYQDFLNELVQKHKISILEAKAYINDMANMGYIEI